MTYIYQAVDDLESAAKVGTFQCVALVKHYGKAPVTSLWKAGDSVMGNLRIAKGTAIATFVDGKYESNATGNHAGFYISQDASGLWIMDQWADNNKKPKISKRYLRRQGRLPSGRFKNPSNNADAYSVIE